MNIYKERVIRRLFGDNAIKHNDEYIIHTFGNDIGKIQKKLGKIYDEAEDYTQEAWYSKAEAQKDAGKTKKDLEMVAKSLIDIAQKWYRSCIDSV